MRKTQEVRNRVAQVHRFQDYVCLYTTGNVTVRLSPDEARAIATALNLAAFDVNGFPFVQSRCGTKVIELKGEP